MLLATTPFRQDRQYRRVRLSAVRQAWRYASRLPSPDLAPASHLGPTISSIRRPTGGSVLQAPRNIWGRRASARSRAHCECFVPLKQVNSTYSGPTARSRISSREESAAFSSVFAPPLHRRRCLAISPRRTPLV